MAAKRPTGRSRTAKETPDSSVSPDVVPVTAAIDAYLASLDLDERGEVLAAVARNLAVTLDIGAGLAAAAVSKELREVLAALGGDDVGDGDAFSAWEAQLGTPS